MSKQIDNDIEFLYEKILSIGVFSDNKTIAIGTDDNTIVIYDIINRNIINIIKSQIKKDTDMIITSDNKILITLSIDDNNYNIDIWSTETYTKLYCLPQKNNIKNISISPDNKKLISSYSDKYVKIWNLENGQLENNIYIDIPKVKCNIIAIFSKNMKNIICACHDIIKIINLDTEEHYIMESNNIFKYQSLQNIITSITISKCDDNVFFVGDKNGNINVLTIDRSIHNHYFAHTQNVNSLSSSSDGKRIASGSSDYSIVIWDIETGNIINKFTDHYGSVKFVGFSQDNNMLISRSLDDTIRIWDTFNGERGLKTKVALRI